MHQQLREAQALCRQDALRLAIRVLWTSVAVAALHACSMQPPQDSPAPAAAEPSVAGAQVPTHPLKEAWFGEQHIHTAYSLDA